MTITITKSQYPNINWTKIDNALLSHNQRFNRSYELIAVLDNPPFTDYTKLAIFCPTHNKFMTITTVNELYNEEILACLGCAARKKSKWIAQEDYQKKINQFFGSSNYQIHLLEPYHGGNTNAKLYCQKHKTYSRTDAVTKLVSVLEFPFNRPPFWYCKKCRAESG